MAHAWRIGPQIIGFNLDEPEEILFLNAYLIVRRALRISEPWMKDFETVFLGQGKGLSERALSSINDHLIQAEKGSCLFHPKPSGKTAFMQNRGLHKVGVRNTIINDLMDTRKAGDLLIKAKEDFLQMPDVAAIDVDEQEELFRDWRSRIIVRNEADQDPAPPPRAIPRLADPSFIERLRSAGGTPWASDNRRSPQSSGNDPESDGNRAPGSVGPGVAGISPAADDDPAGRRGHNPTSGTGMDQGTDGQRIPSSVELPSLPSSMEHGLSIESHREERKGSDRYGAVNAGEGQRDVGGRTIPPEPLQPRPTAGSSSGTGNDRRFTETGTREARQANPPASPGIPGLGEQPDIGDAFPFPRDPQFDRKFPSGAPATLEDNPLKSQTALSHSPVDQTAIAQATLDALLRIERRLTALDRIESQLEELLEWKRNEGSGRQGKTG